MSDRLAVAAVAAIIIAGVCISYMLALAGEPQSAWLWSWVL